MHRFLIFIILLFIVQHSQAGQTYTFHLQKLHRAELSFLGPSKQSMRPKSENQRLESISKFPEKYKILDVYQEDMQSSYTMSKHVLADEKEKNDTVKRFGRYYLQYLMKFAGIKPYDRILSACKVQDANGRTRFIVDENNDEDLSNDPLLEFTSSESDFMQSRTIDVQWANRDIEIEFFNGSTLVDTTYSISLVHRKEADRRTSYFTSTMIPAGYITLAGKKYFMAVEQMFPDVQYLPVDFVWIDLNNNKKFDMHIDYYRQIYFPFTLDGISYRITQIHPSGKSITLQEQDQTKFPPVAEGLPAPDYHFTRTDTATSLLELQDDNYLLLDFWSCVSNFCSKNLLELHNTYKNKFRTVVIPFDASTIQNMDKETVDRIKQVSRIIPGDAIEQIRYLYQVGPRPCYVLIGPEGYI
ncbi:MAG: hypothetical protein GF313_10335 [Caldithrix sp.]|nr:hypothetical protein [Caldithrix sp.]